MMGRWGWRAMQRCGNADDGRRVHRGSATLSFAMRAEEHRRICVRGLQTEGLQLPQEDLDDDGCVSQQGRDGYGPRQLGHAQIGSPTLGTQIRRMTMDCKWTRVGVGQRVRQGRAARAWALKSPARARQKRAWQHGVTRLLGQHEHPVVPPPRHRAPQQC